MGGNTLRLKRSTLYLAVVATFGLVALAGIAQAVAHKDTHGRQVTPKAEPVEHVPTSVDNMKWAVRTFQNELGEQCLNDVAPGETGSLVCLPKRADPFAEHPVIWSIGAQQAEGQPLEWSYVWISGLAAPSIARLEIVATDCSTSRLKLDQDGVFLIVVTRAMLRRGEWPYRLAAFDGSGNAVFEDKLPIDTPPTPAARQAGLTKPDPKPACSAP